MVRDEGETRRGSSYAENLRREAFESLRREFENLRREFENLRHEFENLRRENLRPASGLVPYGAQAHRTGSYRTASAYLHAASLRRLPVPAWRDAPRASGRRVGEVGTG
jgi:hypothetical protein